MWSSQYGLASCALKTGRILLAVCLSLIVLNLAAIAQIDLQPLGTYQSGLFDESAAEIVAHAPSRQRLYVVNANSGNIDVLDIYYPANPTLLFQIDTAPYGAGANSIDIHNGTVAVAVEADPAQTPGTVVFFNTDGEFLSAVTVGALPDMLTFTPDGQSVLVANEGEPDEYCLTDDESDPEGSVSVINLMNGVANLTQADVRTADFTNFTADNIHPDIRIFGPRCNSRTRLRTRIHCRSTRCQHSMDSTSREQRHRCIRHRQCHHHRDSSHSDIKITPKITL